ncbi:MAG: hypothetical protein Q8N54_00200 [Sulfurimicrobium sp.]|nr:hypothetical protein [Sulfurimicrobium sp.]MDZ7655628.1 hypothetical protein [Sulfurimicrobium sp.]
MNTQVKRKIHYIDPAIQNRMLLAFVLLEVLLIGIGMIVLYQDLKEVVDENLFRIHFSSEDSLSALLLREAMQALTVLVIANLAALGLAKWLWLRYLNSILGPLSGLLARTGNLDFTPDESFAKKHVVLELALAWREVERERCKGIRAEISRLIENADDVSPRALEQTRAALEKLKALLPAHKIESANRPD